MKVRENEFFKHIDFEFVFDEALNGLEKQIDIVIPLNRKYNGYAVDIVGNLLTGLTKVEVFGIGNDGDTIELRYLDHETILKWANVELDKYVERNKEAIMRTFPYQFEPQPTDGIRIL